MHYQYEDPLGKVNCTYTYDPLNQLISEDKHTYLFDSIHNRLAKDNLPHTVNNLCQIMDDGKRHYEYDPDGNLMFDGIHSESYEEAIRILENS